MEKKYELTNETIDVNGYTLHRIKALKNFADVEKGDMGGFIEKEENLSHEGYCWVYDNAWILDGAKVYKNAVISGNSLVFGDALVHGYAKISGDSKVCGNAEVYGNALVCSDSKICEDAYVSSNDDYLVVSPIGSRRDTTTFFKCKDESIKVTCGCFIGTIDEFKDKVIETHKDSKYAKEYLSAIEMAKSKFLKKSNDMKKKYELTNETIEIDGHMLYRIKALKNFGDVKKGDLGGFIEKEENLSHEGYCWVYENAKVFGNAKVFEHAEVYGYAGVYNDAKVFGNAELYGNSIVSGDANVYGDSIVFGDSVICCNAHVYGYTMVCKDAYISSNDDYLVVSPIGSKNDTTTFFKCKDESIKVSCGCFIGTLDEFKDKVIETHGDNRYAKQYLSAIEMAKSKFSKGE